MYLFYLCVLCLVQHNLCSEVEDVETVSPIEIPLELDYLTSIEDDSSIIDSQEDISNEIDSDEETDEDYEEDDYGDEDYDCDNDSEQLPIVSFAGPVQAKGTVSVGATYGYDTPFNSIAFPPRTKIQPVFYPVPYYPYLPYNFYHGPLVSMFLDNLGHESIENLLDEIYLEATPLNLDVVKSGDLDNDDHDGNKNDGVVFGGLIPASGKVTVAARF